MIKEENNSVNQKKLDYQELEEAPIIETNSSSNEWYFDIINSEDPFVAFNELRNENKAAFWDIKYNLFQENSNLSQEQLYYLNILSDFVHEAHLVQSYDEE